MKKVILITFMIFLTLVMNGQAARKDLINRTYESTPDALFRFSFTDVWLDVYVNTKSGFSNVVSYPYYLSNSHQKEFDKNKVGKEISGRYLVYLESTLDDNGKRADKLRNTPIRLIARDKLILTIDKKNNTFLDKGENRTFGNSRPDPYGSGSGAKKFGFGNGSSSGTNNGSSLGSRNGSGSGH